MRITLDPVWRLHLIRLVAVIGALLLIFVRDVADMLAIWWNVSTYTHCLFIVPIAAWLVWQRRHEVMAIPPRGYAPGLALVALGGLSWMLGQAAGVSLFRHAGLIFMIQASVLTLLGPAVTRALLFPLFYLCFLVPFGDELVPALQTVTAKLCMLFLGWAGIPAHIEGVFISIPTGLFEVAEACSGVKFLVAMVAYGALVANVCFTQWWRRAAFMAMAVTVPIIANGIRAYATIHISYLTGNNDFAASFDHIIFGWVFFALVMAIVVAIGWKFFDRGIDDRWLGDWAQRDQPASPPMRWTLGLVTVVLALVPVGWMAATASLGRENVSHAIDLPEVNGWTRVEIAQSFPWKPRFDGADHQLFGQYANAAGQRVDLAIVVYGWQEEGKEIVGYAQGAFDPGSRWSWANDTVSPSGGKGERIFASGVEREVLSFYRIGGTTTGNASTVKLETIKSKLLGGRQTTTAVLLSAEGSKGSPSRPKLDAFLRDLGPVDMLADTTMRRAEGR